MNRYYVVEGAARTGPFGLDELRARGAALTADTLVWTQGMHEWLPAQRVPELAALLGHVSPSTPPTMAVPVATDRMAATPSAPVMSTSDDFILANPRLPRMAQLLSVYALLVNPTIWLLSNFSCLMTTRWDDPSPTAGPMRLVDLLWAVISAACAVILALGAWRLRRLQRSGVTMLIAGLSVSVAWNVLMIIAVVTISIAYSAASSAAPDPPRTPGAVEVLNIFLLTLFVVVFAYEVVSLIWLVRRRQRLPF